MAAALSLPGRCGPLRTAARKQEDGVSMLLRNADPSDAPGIARVEIEAWRDTYPTLVPQSYLIDHLDIQRRTGLWHRRLLKGRGETVIGAFDAKNIAVGYVAFGQARNRADSRAGELYELYLLPDAQAQGLGRRLCITAADHLLRLDTTSMCVEVLEGNPSRYFYEAMGARLAARRKHRFAGTDLPALIYRWDDLKTLAGQCAR